MMGKDEKIFIIGRNKTGTTSLKEFFANLGYRIGDQATAELFIDDYEDKNFKNILSYCDSAEVFQDAPFSWPETYKHVYKKYPNAKYILLERDSSEVWFNSLLRFHQKIVKDGKPIDANDLKNFDYRRKGFLWQAAQVVYGVDETTLYNKDMYIKNYEDYNTEVKELFKGNNNFINISLSNKGAQVQLAEFLNRPLSDIKIPHSNNSA
jgi:enoyl reductase-like protein